jgi:hypothetical protein
MRAERATISTTSSFRIFANAEWPAGDWANTEKHEDEKATVRILATITSWERRLRVREVVHGRMGVGILSPSTMNAPRATLPTRWILQNGCRHNSLNIVKGKREKKNMVEGSMSGRINQEAKAMEKSQTRSVADATT